MTGRAFRRIPYVVEVDFRTASSFLVSYSVNLSRGGIFLETDHSAAIGTELCLQFTVPGLGKIELVGQVVWRRTKSDADGPPGLGIEFQSMGDELGDVIDQLVTKFKGLHVLLLCARQNDQPLLTRLIRSVIATAQVTASSDFRTGSNLVTEEIDLAIVDIEIYTELALGILRKAKLCQPPLPVIALAEADEYRERALALGADEVIENPPEFHQFGKVLLRALSRPLHIRKSRN